MANYDVTICGTISGVTVDFGSSTPSLGDVWSFSGSSGVPYCGTVNQLSVRPASYTAITQYDTCFDCITGSSLYNSYMFQGCGIIGFIYIDPTSFGSLPDINDVFELTIESRGMQKTSCYTFIGVAYSNRIPGFPEQTLISSTPYVSCELCQFSANSITVEVTGCTDETIYYVTVPTTVGTVISFIQEGTLDQICGIVGPTADTTSNVVYLGSFDDCPTCLSQVNSKREVINCIDGTTEVVYTSTLYNVDESGYLNISNPEEGTSNCFRVGNLTDAEITVTEYLQYSPSLSCDECIACNGYVVLYSACGGEFTGASQSFQYILTGQTFIHPLYGCCEVFGYGTNSDITEDPIYSFYEFTGDCTSNECDNVIQNYETWVANSCDDVFSFTILISVPSGASVGDVYVLKVGNNESACVELDYIYGDGPDPIRLAGVGITSEISYTDCIICNNTQVVGASIVECGTEVLQKVTMTLSDYNNISNSGGIFRLSNYKCYYILDSCNKDENYPLVSPIAFFDNCDTCNEPISAGTEVNFCEQICTDSGTTVVSVVVPHPVWTNGYGKDIIQMGMVTLGGNGLNA
jgi:hypothetical protein